MTSVNRMTAEDSNKTNKNNSAHHNPSPCQYVETSDGGNGFRQTPRGQWVTSLFDLTFAEPFTELKFGVRPNLSRKLKRFH